MGSSIEEQIKAIEEEIFNTQKNKATEHHIGKLKAKLARLRGDLEKRKSQGGPGVGFSLKKSGDATVGIIGFPSIGKSTLLNQLTNADSKIGAYDFTTLNVVPGVLKYKGADIQLLDLPGLIEGAAKGRGRGKEILSAIRSVDLLVLLIDVLQPEKLLVISKELFDAGLRLNQEPPDIVVVKKADGGIGINATVALTHLDEAMVKSIASEFVINADITIREDITEDQLIDFFTQNRVYVPTIVVINKADLVFLKEGRRCADRIRKEGWEAVVISAKNGSGLDRLQELIFSKLQLIRVFMKPVGKQVDKDEPLILRHGQRVEDACRSIHRDMVRQFRYALVTGPSAKHRLQKVGLQHELMDGDILTIIHAKT